MSNDFVPSWTLHLILSWGGKSVRLTVVDNFQWHGSRCGLYTSTIITITTVNCKSLNISHHMLQPPEPLPGAQNYFIWINVPSQPVREQSRQHSARLDQSAWRGTNNSDNSELCQSRPREGAMASTSFQIFPRKIFQNIYELFFNLRWDRIWTIHE